MRVADHLGESNSPDALAPRPVFRNASSLSADSKVVDAPFLDYVRSTPGILVLRPE
ncbi:N-acetylmuramoyl-L-alanine amidase-like domain-containing protein [Nocardia cyriacigeorgica]|uniref:N-acetylmuramoyl-L-alanine amidase-like domain-containing protein n=1 Tax=Nocardia cyriacigeorgica TaxID=135487 RepID=UPI0032AF099A